MVLRGPNKSGPTLKRSVKCFISRGRCSRAGGSKGRGVLQVQVMNLLHGGGGDGLVEITLSLTLNQSTGN